MCGSLLRFCLSLAAVSCIAPGQSLTRASCPVIARLPADMKDTEPPEYRPWFELLSCGSGNLVVKAYERQKSKPSLTFDTGDGYPTQLVHMVNVLVFQSVGGSADHVFVFTFQGGKPSLALRDATSGNVRVIRAEKAVTITFPPKTYPGPDGKIPSVPDKSFSFAIEY